MGNHRDPRIPAGALWVLRRLVPRAEADAVEGELAEGFQARARQSGVRSARGWYRRQVFGFALRFLSVRASGGWRGREALRDLSVDLRWALRSVRRRPSFAAVVAATLALGIGANASIFTFIDAHFLTPLPYDRPEELVLVWETDRNSLQESTIAPGNYFAFRDATGTLERVAAHNIDVATLAGDGAAERLYAAVVVPHFFEVVGVEALLGRTFDEAAARLREGRLALLSHGLWMRRYGADPDIVGRSIRVDGVAHEVIGVMPPSFRHPEKELWFQQPALWRPLLLDEANPSFSGRYLGMIARRRSDASLEQVREELNSLYRRLSLDHSDNEGRRVLVHSLDGYLLAEGRGVLPLLLAAGGTVLLIICANVANLTLARGEERRGEFAIRTALGSGRGRLLRQVVVEGVVLALLGGSFAGLVVLGGEQLLQGIQSGYFSSLVELSVGGRVIAFTSVLAVCAGVAFTLPLARLAARVELRTSHTARGSAKGASWRPRRTRDLLVVGQLGAATALVVAAALLARSFQELVSVPPGFRSAGVVTFEVWPPRELYSTPDRVRAYHTALVEEVRSIAGVDRVGMVSDMPFTPQDASVTFTVEGRPRDPDDPPTAEVHVVIPEYFEILEIPLLSGTMPDGWATEVELPILVNERMRDAFWPDADALGRTLVLDWDFVRARVVGVVANTLDDGYDASPEPTMYVPFGSSPRRSMSYLLRTQGDPAALFQGIRPAVARVDPDVPATGVRVVDDLLAESVARQRAASLVAGAFALVALLVATTGVYGVLSYGVQARTREIGVRAALGATREQVVAMVVGQSTRLVVVGLGLGGVIAFAAARALSGMLFGVGTWDPPSLAFAVVVLGAVSVLAAWLPARRAVRIDPNAALRGE